jgi:CHAT domain-containing protein
MTEAKELRVRDYLLGRLNESAEEQLELRLLNDPQFAEEYDIVVDEIVDDYVAGKFAGDDLKRIEEYFFRSPERKRKLKFALALKQRQSELALASKKRRKHSYAPYLAIAATLLLVIGSLSVWRVLNSNRDVDKGLAALQSAFRAERPLESRISNFAYAPYVVTRGPGENKVDENELRRAELTLLEALKNKPTPAVRHALGKLFLAKKECDKAIEQFEGAARDDPKNAQLYSDLGAAWLEKGKVDLAGTGPGKGMEELGHSLENLNKALQLDPNLSEALFNRALCEQRLALYPQAETDWREYLKRDSTSPWAEEARRNLQALAEPRKNDSSGRTELFDQFIAAYRDRDAKRAWQSIRQSRSRLGNHITERLLDEYLNAAQYKREDAAERLRMLSFAAQVESQAVGDLYASDLVRFYAHANRDECQKLRDARALAASANQQYDRSEFEPAIALYRKAVQTFSLAGDTCEALANESQLGYCELRLAESNSRERFARLSATYESRGYKSLLAQALHAQSDAETQRNEFSLVLTLAGKALQQADAIQDDVTKLRCLQQFVSINRQFGNYTGSLSYGLQALTISRGASADPKLMWTFYHEIALNFYWLKISDAAVQFEQEALRLALETNWPFIIVRSYTQLGIILEQQGKYDEAIQAGQLAVTKGQTIVDEKARLNIVSHALMRLGHLYRQAGDFNGAITQYDQALGMFGKLQLGMFLYEAHKGKFMALAASGQTSAAATELAPTLQLFEQYRAKIHEEKSRDSFFDVGQDTYDMAIDFAYATQKDLNQAFDYAERARARSLLSLTTEPLETNGSRGIESPKLFPRSLHEIQASIPASVQVIEYSVLKDKTIVWVLSRESLQSSSINVPAETLDSKISNYVALISRPASVEETTAAARELYSLLINPVEPLLEEHKQLCIVPDKTLTKLPFASLLSPANGKFLIERFGLLFAASTNVFINSTEVAAKRIKRAPEIVLSIGNPSFSRARFPDLSDLPAAADEARQIAVCYNSRPVLNSDASEERIRAGLMKADVAHFACHFVIDQNHPESSGLVLADLVDKSPSPSESDGLLQASEIEQLRFARTRLVILSACQTGIERVYRGEGVISLARSFIAAGVPLVVASLWPVESEAAEQLMIRFHRYRKQERLSTVDALRKAQLDMMSLPDEKSRQAVNWASFQVFGGYANF